MVRATLDTNVYVSALNFGGRYSQLFGMSQAGELGIDISAHILDELTRVLREDFEWDGYRLKFMRDRILKLANLVSPQRTVRVVDDPDDDRIIECAVTAGSDLILTDDKALLRVKEFEGIKIMRPHEFLK